MKMKISDYAPIVLRFGLVFVFIWFGLSQLMNQQMWTVLIPKYAISLSGLSATRLVIINGAFEVIAAILLAFGIQIRVVAALLCLHLITIVADVGLSSIGVRDVGLTVACLSVALYGADRISFDKMPASPDRMPM